MPDFQIPVGLAGFALKQFIEAARGDELDRLFAALSDELGETTGLSAVGLAPIRDDPHVLRLILEFLDADVAEDDALIRAIEPHVYQADEETPAREVARTVVDAIKRLAWRARKTDREATVHELRRLHEETRTFGTPRYLSLDWVPPAVHVHIQKFGEEQPEEARHLEDALRGTSNPRRALEALVRRPQSWLASGSPELWTVVGRLSAAHGAWYSAEHAFLAGTERPGADRAALFAKCADMAHVRGDTISSEEYLEDARAIDPDHPEIALVETRGMDDPRAQLDRLSEVETRNPSQQAAVLASRALAHLALGQIAEAEECGELARVAQPESPLVRELAPLTVLLKEVNRGSDEEPDWVALGEAAAAFIELRGELLDVRRHSEAARMAARAAECFSVGGEFARAAEMLEQITAEEVDASDDEARLHLAQTALRTRPDLVQGFLAHAEVTDRVRLLRAAAATATGPDEAFERGLTTLNDLITSTDQAIRVQAALARLTVSAQAASVAWSEEAEAAFTEVDDQRLAPTLKAEHLIALGDKQSAEDILLDNQENPRALELLAELAEEAADWNKALALLEALVDRAPSAARRLQYAETLMKADRNQEALAVLAALRSEETAPTALRGRAYALSAQKAWDMSDFAGTATLARQWNVLTGSRTAAWVEVRALLRISEYEQALSLVDSKNLDPHDAEEGRVLAYLFHRALPPNDALARIADLSDRFDRSDEYLEGMVVLAGLGADGDLPESLDDRRRVALEAFPSRFPESQMIRAFPAPETAEEIEAFFQEHFAAGTETQAEVAEQVAKGDAAVSVLAAVAHREVSTVWGRLERLPLGYGDPTLDDLEATDAAQAIGGPASWDPSAIVIAGGLGDPLTRAILDALPGSIVPLAVLEDVDRASHELSDASETRIFAAWDPVAGQPRVTVMDSEWSARDHNRAEGAFALARQLREVPNTNPTAPTRFDGVIVQTEEQPALQTWAASFAVAVYQGVPLYSDDRYIRAQARREGLAAFGTTSLLRALVARGRISQEASYIAQRRLRASGALGLVPTETDLAAEGEAAGWMLTPSLRQALLDPTGWGNLGANLKRHTDLLRAVFASDRSKLDDWVARIIDAARIALPPQALHRYVFILLSSVWASEEPALVRALIRSLRTRRLAFALYGDPVAPAFELLLGFGAGTSPRFQLAILSHLLAKLEPSDERALLRRVPPKPAH